MKIKTKIKDAMFRLRVNRRLIRTHIAYILIIVNILIIQTSFLSWNEFINEVIEVDKIEVRASEKEEIKIMSRDQIIEGSIREMARERGLDVEKVVRIARCENRGFVPERKNPTSTATGIFQFIRGSWEYYGKKYWGATWVDHDVKNWKDNITLGTWVMSEFGYYPWEASKHCWGI